MKPEYKDCLPYLDNVDQNIDTFLQFGADKAEVRDVEAFLTELNVSYADLQQLVQAQPLGRDTPSTCFKDRFRGCTLYSAPESAARCCARTQPSRVRKQRRVMLGRP